MAGRLTDLLYLPTIDAAYERSFSGRISALPPGAVVLDRTLFYPTGGGQPCDLGSLVLGDGETLSVTDVSRSGAAVVHRLSRRGAAPGLAIGAEVRGTIDWDRRYRHMRLHTFQHLLSARIFALWARRTRRAALSGSGGTLDLDGPPSVAPSLEDLVADVRRYLDRDLPVAVRTIPRAEYDRSPGDRSGLVTLPAHVDPVRLIEIEAADRCPCGGTHLRRTGEVGGFRLHEPVPISGGDVRVAFTLDVAAPTTRTG